MQPNRTVLQWPGQLWRWLTKPTPSIREPERRRQAQFLASLLLMIMLLILALVPPAAYLVDPTRPIWQDAIVQISLFTAFILAITYCMSRTQHYLKAAGLAIGIMVVAVFASAIPETHWTDIFIFDYLIVAILISSIVFSIPTTLVIIIACIVGLLLFPIFVPAAPFNEIVVNPLNFVVINATLILIITHHRNLLEADRQAALHESESKYRALLEQASDGIFITDPQGNYVLVNPKGCEMLGYTQDELLGLNMRGLIPSEDLVVAPLRFDELYAGKTVRVERRLRHKHGSLLPVEVSARMLDDGRLQAIVRDITERKQAEAALRESEAQYRSLFEDAPIPVSEQDFSAVKTYIEELQSQGVKDFRAYFESHPEAVIQCAERVKIINLNKSSLELYQAGSKEELMRGLAQLFDQESYEAFKEVLIAIAQGKSRLEQEVINYTLTGERKNIVLSWSVVPSYEETFSKVLVSLVDITERKRLEEQLRQAQKMEAIGRLAGGVAHDFNNILTVIKGYSGLLMDSLGSEDPQHKDVEQIGKAAERASLLTNQLLAFSRKQVLQPAILDLNIVVMNMDKMLRRLIGEDIELVTILDPNLGKVKVDPSQMEQVIINLAINARDAMPFGGKLTIETTNVMFDEEYIRRHVETQLGPHIMLAISDTGQGMDKETRSHLFEPFFTTKEQGKGTGLGLATVHGIVTQSGGHIWVYSEVNQGTTFKVYLPQMEEVISPINQKGQVSTLSTRGSETILLVEDEDTVRALTHRVLSEEGYIVLEAQNGEEALRVAKQHGGQIDLLLTDVVMPGGMSGRHLAERLTALLYREMKVLYMSGYTDNAIVHHGVLTSGIAFLQKPFTPTRLADTVREILDIPPA